MGLSTFQTSAWLCIPDIAAEQSINGRTAILFFVLDDKDAQHCLFQHVVNHTHPSDSKLNQALMMMHVAFQVC